MMSEFQNKPLSFFCYALNKFIAEQNAIESTLEGINKVKSFLCAVAAEISDRKQPKFNFALRIDNFSDDYVIENVNINLSLDFCLNRRTGFFEIEIDDGGKINKYKTPITDINSFMKVYKEAEKYFYEKLNAIYDTIDAWESDFETADRMREIDIEHKIDESRLEEQFTL